MAYETDSASIIVPRREDRVLLPESSAQFIYSDFLKKTVGHFKRCLYKTSHKDTIYHCTK